MNIVAATEDPRALPPAVASLLAAIMARGVVPHAHFALTGKHTAALADRVPALAVTP